MYKPLKLKLWLGGAPQAVEVNLGTPDPEPVADQLQAVRECRRLLKRLLCDCHNCGWWRVTPGLYPVEDVEHAECACPAERVDRDKWKPGEEGVTP